MKQFMKPACILIAALLFISTEKCNGSVLKNLDEDYKRAGELKRPAFSEGKVGVSTPARIYWFVFSIFYLFFSNVVYCSCNVGVDLNNYEGKMKYEGKILLNSKLVRDWSILVQNMSRSRNQPELSFHLGPVFHEIMTRCFMKLDFVFLNENVRLLIIPYCLGYNISSTQYVETDSADKSVENLWT